MKKEISPVAIICIVVGVAAAVVVGVFFMIRSDPVAQGPHPPPRFDPAAREAEEARNRPPASMMQPASPTQVPPGTHPSDARPGDDMRPGDLKPRQN